MMTNAARKDWLQEQLAKADYCHLGAWGSDDTYDVQGDLEDLLAECERLGTESMLWQRDWGRAVADRRALVAVLRLLNEPIAICAYPGYEKDIAYSRVLRMREAVQALGAELQGEIDDG